MSFAEKTQNSRSAETSLLSKGHTSLFLLLTALAFVFAEGWPLQKNGMWLDELFAFWASDPSHPFKEILAQRILPDSNPPAFFSLLYGFRQFSSDVGAALAINTIFLGAAIIWVFLVARRAALSNLANLAVGFFLVSGPVLYYFTEARAYLGALATTFVASWLAAQSTADRDSFQPPMEFAAIGCLAALIHVYASIYCCALAAAMILVALSEENRRRLLAAGLALGLSAGLTSALTLLPMRDSLAKIDWIKFDLPHVISALAKMAALSSAPIWVVAALLLFLTTDMKRGGERSVPRLLAVTYLCFLLLPILISFYIPIISARYWTIGAPGLIVLVIFLFSDWHPKPAPYPRFLTESRMHVALAVLAVGVLLSGFAAATFARSAKLIWSRADDIRSLLSRCPPHSIRVANSFTVSDQGMRSDGAFVPAFSYVSAQPEDVFVQVRGSGLSKLQSAGSDCPVVGWVENLDPAALSSASDRELLELLNIDAHPDEFEVRRRRSGYLVVQKLRGETRQQR